MNDTEYKSRLRQAFTVARLLLELESLPQLLEAQQHAEAFGCFIDPTLWMRGIGALEQHKEIIAALMDAQIKIRRAREKLGPIFEQQLAEAARAAEAADSSAIGEGPHP